MTLAARKQPNLDLALLPNHVTVERQRSVASERRARLLIPAWLAQVQVATESGDMAVPNGSVEQQLAGGHPVFGRVQLGRFERDLWFLAFQPGDVAGWFLTRMVDGVTLVDGTNRNAVVVLRRNLDRAGGPNSERELQRSNRLIVPRPRDGDGRRCRRRRGG